MYRNGRYGINSVNATERCGTVRSANAVRRAAPRIWLKRKALGGNKKRRARPANRCAMVDKDNQLVDYLMHSSFTPDAATVTLNAFNWPKKLKTTSFSKKRIYSK